MRRVVVTGIGAVTPLGTGIPQFFEGLRKGKSGIDQIRSFDATSFQSRIAAQVNGFDYSMVPSHIQHCPAILRDPKSAFGIVAAMEALDDAFPSHSPTHYYNPENIAVMLSTGLEIFHPEDIVLHLKDGIVDFAPLISQLMESPPHSFLQIPSDLGASAIAAMVNSAGLYSVNVSACAAGTQAIGEAYRAISDGVADMAITGGYDSMVNPIALGGFCMLQALSTRNQDPESASRPFDKTRDGFVLGEGAGIVVLESMETAERRNAVPYGEIIGYGTTMDAYRVTDPAEDQSGATKALRAALTSANTKPNQIDYINAHGTATRKNDPAETNAIKKVLGEHANEIPISSTKSQIGHLIGAAGAVEFIAGLFALQEQIVPATINLNTPDPECDLNYVPNIPQSRFVKTFMSNSFGFGGQNAAIIARVV